jgi:hypothetical protein
MPENCAGCTHLQHPDGGHCYMFAEPPPVAHCPQYAAASRRYRLCLEVDWDATSPLEALRAYVEMDGGPDLLGCTWTVTDLEHGLTFAVTLDDGVHQNRVLLLTDNGASVPLAQASSEE